MKFEYLGNIYEDIGTENGKIILQSVNDDSYLLVSSYRLESNDFTVISD